MNFLKRIFLFIVINFLVVITISIILNIFHVQPYLHQYGIDYTSLMIFCLIWGMGGAFISLAMSRVFAKWMMGVNIINPRTKDPREKQLLSEVYNLCHKAGLSEMPEVGIFSSPEINAFATGPTKRRSLVAVSSGLLDKMDTNQIQGVLAHEISHIVNGDMVTMTLIQGIVNAFVMFLARILALIFSGFGRSDGKRGSYGMYMLFVILFEIVFMILGSLIVFWFSRQREFKADAGGARLAGKDRMIEALEALKTALTKGPHIKEPVAAFQTLKISTPTKTGFARLLSSHPPIEERIEKLKNL